MSFFTALIALVAIAVGAIAIIGPSHVWRQIYGDPDLGPFSLATLTRSTKPHDGLLCTPGACPAGLEPDGELPVYDEAPAELLAKLAKHIEAQEGTRQSVNSDVDSGSIRYVTWSAMMKFPDTIQFWAVTLPDGKTGLVGYARAQVGHSDFGANLQRLKDWTGALDP
ncbi:MAG: DUF1499 domain-containing protein [Pseudomonadota bacterium]